MPLRVGFAGTPAFAATALAAIQAAGYEIPLVLTQPDRPAGRGLQLQPSAVKALAQSLGLELSQPRSLRLDGRYPDDAAAARAVLESTRPDVLVVAAYGLILPPWVLTLPVRGCLNIHGSILPRWRGAAPIQRAVEAGDRESGITIMQMDAGLDTGDMLLLELTPITPADTSATLHVRLADMGARLVVEALGRLQRGALERVPQPADGVTYAHKIEKSEAAIDWRQPAERIERRIRAFDPFPGASFVWQGESVKLWRAAVHAAGGTPGQVIDLGGGAPGIACGVGSLELVEVQRPGGRRMPAHSFLQSAAGAGLRAGAGLELPAA